MKAELLKETYLYGIIPPKSQIFNDFDFYENDSTLPSVYLKKVKIWFGKHKNSEKKKITIRYPMLVCKFNDKLKQRN